MKLDSCEILRVKKTALGVDGKRQEWHNIVVEMMIEQRTKGMSGFDRDILEWNVPEEAFFVCHLKGWEELEYEKAV